MRLASNIQVVNALAKGHATHPSFFQEGDIDERSEVNRGGHYSLRTRHSFAEQTRCSASPSRTTLAQSHATHCPPVFRKTECLIHLASNIQVVNTHVGFIAHSTSPSPSERPGERFFPYF